jgi:tRNA A-37 threonylcarbamoyl transferase component Bud32
MPSVDQHPTVVELEAFALGRLDNPVAEAVEEHVADCSACQQVIDQAPADSLVTLLRSADSVSDTVKDAASADTSTDVNGAVPESSGSRTGAWSSADSARPSDVPTTLLSHPRYEAVRLLGHGGMGAVWLAEHRVMGRQVAVKVIRPELVAKTGTAERFRREVLVAARLRHPNIVAAFDAELAGETHLLAMEYIDGVTLADELRRRGPLPVAEACDVVRQAALGLQHAFECGLIHRDLKPHNLMRTVDGTVKVLDFGLAVLADAADRAGGLTGQNVVLGTPDYIAPEQAEDSHAADVRSDIYSLGCTLYQLLTGRVPFPDESVLRKLDGHRMREPEPVCDIRPDVPAELAAVVRKMMAKKPAHRFQTPAEVAEALEPFAFSRPEKKRSRRWLWVAAAAVLCAVTLAGVVVHRIQTDTGELVITVESDDVEVVVRQGGRVVRVIDTKTDRSITLRSGQYELELRDAGEGLKLNIKSATLTRGATVLAKIERVPRPEMKPQEKPVAAVPGKIELFQHIAVTAPGGFFYDIDISKGGKYALVTRDIRGANELDVYDLQTGEQTMEGPGYKAAFLDDDHVVAANEGTLRVYEASSGNLLRQGPMRDIWGMAVAPGGKHLVYTNPLGCFLFDLTTMKELHGWTRTGPAATDGVLFSADGKRLFVRLDANESWQVWDVEKNRAASDYAWLGKERLLRFLPDGKTVLAIQDGKYAHLDAATGKVRATLRPIELPPGLQNFAVVTRGQFVLGGFTDGTVRLLSLAAPQELARYLFPENDRIRTEPGGWHACVAVSSDDQYTAVVTRRTLWILRLSAAKVGNR